MDHLILPVTLAVLALGLLAWALSRRLRERRDRALLAEAIERNRHLPQSLHPVIDPDICIGSLSCLKACPEGDILGVVDGAARLIQGANCIGHGRCANECPVGAIRLVFGTSERGVDLPEVDGFFESSRPGVHIVGELGGMGLIRNAVTQGLECAEYLAQRLLPARPGANTVSDVADVAIVGAGPAGLAAALGCRKAGLSFRVIEQDSVYGTMAHYPRHKVVMTEPVVVPFYGSIGKRTISKENLIATWTKALSRANIVVEERTRVIGLAGADGAFTLETDRGPIRARKIVLATGRRGSPRKLNVPGEELPKVTYRLIDPAQYAHRRVLVVGGGDSALEAAMALATEGGAEVTLSYRNAELGRCRDANRQRFHALLAQGKLRALMPSQVTAIRPTEVDLQAGDTVTTLPNDYVIVCIGGELPLEFLARLQVQVKRFHGTAPGGEAAPGARPRRQEMEARRRKRLAILLAVLGFSLVALLTLRGFSYYLTPGADRVHAPEHAFLRSSGPWGHGIGVVATAFMLSNFLYVLRKRLPWFKGSRSIRTWLTFHMFVGLMCPLVIAFHAAFQAKNQLAALTYVSLAVVVGTGLVGRFIYGLIPRDGAVAQAQPALLADLERVKDQLARLAEATRDRVEAQQILARLSSPPPRRAFVLALLRLPFDSLRARRALRQLREQFPSREDHRRFRRAALRLSRLQTQTALYAGLRRLLSGWRLLHAGLAILLVLAIAAHIAVSLFLGYRWVF